MDDRWEANIMEFGAINITGFRIVDTERRYVKDFMDGWKRLDTNSKDTISVSVQFKPKIALYFSFLMKFLNEIIVFVNIAQQYLLLCILMRLILLFFFDCI